VNGSLNILREERRSIPSLSLLFVWNIDETSWPTDKAAPPNVIVAPSTKPGTVTVPEERDDVQLTFTARISAFGDSATP
jgi:hypothetical protein